MSASVVSQHLNPGGVHLYQATGVGIVYAPEGVQINCAYASDGATRGDPTGCKGGNFCQNPADMWCAGKPHAPSQLADVLRHPSGGGYNEMILDVNFIEQHLPKAVDGIFYLKAGGKLSKGRAARVRAAFLQEHRIVNPTANFPLLVLDASREASQAGMPFSADLDTA